MDIFINDISFGVVSLFFVGGGDDVIVFEFVDSDTGGINSFSTEEGIDFVIFIDDIAFGTDDFLWERNKNDIPTSYFKF